MTHGLLAAAVVALFLLHQDIWFWRTARPLVFGFLPIGLFYHAVYSLAVAGLMWALVRFAWPAHLETAAEHAPAATPPRAAAAGRAAPDAAPPPEEDRP